jgi:serine/threonine protein phosphatase PrpC
MATSATVVQCGRVIFPSGYAEAQGQRPTMEDSIAIVGDFAGSGTAYFAVFDGHGGSDVSRFAAHNLHRRLGTVFSSDIAVQKLITNTFSEIDSSLTAQYAEQGCTAAVAIVVKDAIYAANVGDSRVVLVEPDGTVRQLSVDHRATDPDERARIIARGGLVFNGRAGGVLALSRSLGDGALKAGCISAEPHIAAARRRDGQLLIVACDGVWDVMDNAAAAGIARAQKTPAAAARAIRDAALKRGTTDNVSVVVAFLTRN